MAANWSTIHIFGFGDVQVIAKDGGATKKASDLTKLQAVIDNVWSFKPVDNPITKQYHAINIFEGMFADWQSKEPKVKGFRTEYSKLDNAAIQALVDEILPPVVVAPTVTPTVEAADTTTTTQAGATTSATSSTTGK